MEIITLLAKFFEENMSENTNNRRYWATWFLIFLMTVLFGGSAVIVAISQLLKVL